MELSLLVISVDPQGDDSFLGAVTFYFTTLLSEALLWFPVTNGNDYSVISISMLKMTPV